MIFYESMGRKVSIAILDFTNLKDSLNKINEFLLINDDLDDKSTYEISNDDNDLAVSIDQLKYFKGYKAYLDSINLNVKNGILIKYLQSIYSFNLFFVNSFRRISWYYWIRRFWKSKRRLLYKI